MVIEHSRDIVRVGFHHLIDVYPRLFVAFFLIENPCVSVEESGIVRLCLNGLVAHLLCSLQVAVLGTEEVSIIIKALYLVGIIDQATVIRHESLLLTVHGMKDVAHKHIYFRRHVGRSIIIYAHRTIAESLQSALVILIKVSGKSEIVIKCHFIGIVSYRLFAFFHHILVDGITPENVDKL